MSKTILVGGRVSPEFADQLKAKLSTAPIPLSVSDLIRGLLTGWLADRVVLGLHKSSGTLSATSVPFVDAVAEEAVKAVLRAFFAERQGEEGLEDWAARTGRSDPAAFFRGVGP